MARYCVFLGFSLNSSYITSEICENRSKPEVHCNGKCYLMKKLKQVEENESRGSSDKMAKAFEHELIVPAIPFQLEHVIPEQIEGSANIADAPGYDQEFVVLFFHPPQRS